MWPGDGGGEYYLILSPLTVILMNNAPVCHTGAGERGPAHLNGSLVAIPSQLKAGQWLGASIKSMYESTLSTPASWEVDTGLQNMGQ